MTDHTDEVAAVYERSCAPLIGLLTAMGGSRTDAEEVAHDAFVRLLGQWHRVRTYDDPVAWLRTVAVRMLIDRFRHQRVAQQLRMAASGSSGGGSSPGPTPDRVALERALNSLSVDHRVVVILHHGLDLPVEEVAQMLNLRSGTVKSRLARARQALAPLLRGEELSEHE